MAGVRARRSSRSSSSLSNAEEKRSNRREGVRIHSRGRESRTGLSMLSFFILRLQDYFEIEIDAELSYRIRNAGVWNALLGLHHMQIACKVVELRKDSHGYDIKSDSIRDEKVVFVSSSRSVDSVDGTVDTHSSRRVPRASEVELRVTLSEGQTRATTSAIYIIATKRNRSISGISNNCSVLYQVNRHSSTHHHGRHRPSTTTALEPRRITRRRTNPLDTDTNTDNDTDTTRPSTAIAIPIRIATATATTTTRSKRPDQKCLLLLLLLAPAIHLHPILPLARNRPRFRDATTDHDRALRAVQHLRLPLLLVPVGGAVLYGIRFFYSYPLTTSQYLLLSIYQSLTLRFSCCEQCYDTTTHPSSLAGCIISKLEPHTSPSGTSPFPPTLRGYIAMLAVPTSHRGRGIATRLVRMAIDAMVARDADEVVLETEVTNEPAIKLYQRLGFLRSKRLHRYYLSGGSAFRLVLPLKEGAGGFGMMGTGEGEGQGDGLPVREDEEHLGRHVC